MNNEKKKDGGFMMKLSTFIVDKRNLFFLIFIILIIFSAFSRNWVQVENDLSLYLPETSETKKGLNVMNEQFTTFGSADIMFANVTYDEAENICEEIEGIEGVQGVDFDDTTDHYNNASALYSITFDYDEDDDKCLESLDAIMEKYADYDTYLSTSLGDTSAEQLQSEVNLIMVFVAVIVVAVLILTSQTYAEIPVLLITFLSAMIINMGTNFLLGKISFVSNSVTSILQLALSLDYAVIFCNRFKEEHKTLETREAVILALSKAIPEITSSSLTTVGGLLAMMFMQFQIGPDLAINLIKAIVFSLLSVFLLMPGLLVLFSNLMDKTVHRSFIPKVPFIGKFAYATRKFIPPIFAVILVGAFFFSNQCPYAYGEDGIPTPVQNETQIAKQMIKDTFTYPNMVALTVPSGDYKTERKLLDKLETFEEVDYTMGVANVEAMDGYMLADALTPRQFAELADLDYEAAKVLYTAYAANDEEYGRVVGGIATYKVPLMDMFMFAHDCIDDGYVTLDDDQKETLDSAYEKISNAKLQLCGENNSRMLVYLTIPLGDSRAYEFLETMKSTALEFYPDQEVYIAGNATTEYDFMNSFSTDNIVVSVVSILIVLVVLLFTFKSAGMPILLILVIQGSIWINFALQTMMHRDIFFMSYLIVSSIQMGANIDYAIVIGSRFTELKDKMSKRDAMIETMDFAFPTVITSGTILAAAGILVNSLTSTPSVNGIGCIGRGTILSIFLVLFILPQILLLGEKLIDVTSFQMKKVALPMRKTGHVRLDGFVRGNISGNVTGTIHAVVDGEVDVQLLAGNKEESEESGQALLEDKTKEES